MEYAENLDQPWARCNEQENSKNETETTENAEHADNQRAAKGGRPLTFFFGHFLATFFSFLVTFS